MLRIALLLLLSAALAEESFITQFEYGKMLYAIPRGIGCHHCHGPEGQGQEVARYQNKKGVQRTIQGGAIHSLSIEQFKHALEDATRIMPRYYLTDAEIRAIHLYLQKMRDFR